MDWLLDQFAKSNRRIRRFFSGGPLHRWESFVGYFGHDFARAVALDKERQFYTPSYEQELHARYAQVKSRYNRYLVTVYILIFLLFLSIHGQALEFTIFGVSIAKIAAVKEFILFFSSTAGIVFAFTSVHYDILYDCAKKGFQNAVPSRFAPFWIARASIGDALLLAAESYKINTSRSGKIVICLMLSFVIFSLVYLAAAVVLIFYVHIAVIFDVWQHSNWTRPWAKALIVYVVVLDVVSFLIVCLMTLPMRYLDVDLGTELHALKEKSETEYLVRVAKLFSSKAKKT